MQGRIAPRALLAALALVSCLPAFAESLPPLRDVAEVAIGVKHSCVLSTPGVAYCWGDNEFGQLGLPDGTRSDRTTPVPIPGAGPGLRKLTVGAAQACAITAPGGVICWGWDLEGTLGDGPGEGGPAPVAVAGITNPVQLTAGAAHACALQADGAVRCWGANAVGQLGDGTAISRDAPVAVVNLGGSATAIEAGDNHTCAILAGGSVRCWGSDSSFQLGNGPGSGELQVVSVQGLPGPVKALAAGATATCALTEAGAVYCWGEQYPLGEFEGGSPAARLYPGFDSGFVGLDGGTFHFCALSAAGAVKCFGDGSYGQFGTGPIDGSLGVDTAIGLAPGIVQVVAGGFHSCARSGAGGLQCWGLNTSGELGIDSTTRRLVPTQVSGLTSGIAKVAAGNFASCALTTGGAVKCWGANSQSSLGDGTDLFRLTPVDVVGLQSGVRLLVTGNEFGCVITAARRAKCWGANYDGRLGNGETLNSNVPVDVVGLGDVDVLGLAVGNAHACALLQGGAVKCWGSNEYGQLGDASLVDRRTAVDVAGLGPGVTAITAGYAHTCAIVANGGLKCWGANTAGQLGDGGTGGRSTPVDVVGLSSGVLAVGAGEQHTCVIVTGGAVKCWGFNFYGTILGDESTVDRSVPGDVPALRSGVVQIALGGYETCVRLVDGSMQCWGNTAMGDNTELARPLPTQVAGLETGVSDIDVGFGGQICAVVNGAAKCWIENAFGQLGDGTTHGVPFPQTVLADEAARHVDPFTASANDGSVAASSDASGRFVVFQSRASNLVAGDTNGALDVFRKDRETGTVLRVSVDDAEGQIAGDASEPSISGNGNHVVFVAPDAGVAKARGRRDSHPKASAFGVYLRNLVTGTTTRMGPATTGGTGTLPRISADSAAVVFTSDKSPSGAAARPNVYVVPLGASGAQLVPGTTRCVSCKSVDAAGAEGADANGDSRNAVISADGRFVAFETTAKNALSAVPAPCPGPGADIMLRNLVSGGMQRMSPPPGTPPANCGTTGSTAPSIDYAGDTLAFQTDQPLAGADRNDATDVYVVQLATPAAPLLVSAAPDGTNGNGASGAPQLSGDGRTLTFVSEAANLDLSYADNNDRRDVHAAKIEGTPEVARLSRGTNGAEADAASERPALNYDGTQLAFDSQAKTLAGLISGASNVYQRRNPLAPSVKSATWWKSNESGWGLTIFDQGSVLAPAWFTYDTDGEPTWFLTAGAFPQPDGSYRGELLRLTGTPFDRIDGPAVTGATTIGNVTLRFQGESALDFDYTVQGTTQHKTLLPFPYGSRTFACTASPKAARDDALNYSDLWTGATPSAGWGLTVFHVDSSMFAGWYTYDTDGEAVFFVLATSRQADGSFRGPIFRQRNGVPFQAIDGTASSTGTDQVGQATLRFSDGDSGSFEYTVGSVTQSKAIVRLLVGSRPSVCETADLP
jgi:alpha-tubulin suppressor-like RCC1 family protein/Tol biopolymer transport system component